MRFRLLGPIEIEGAHGPVPVAGRQARLVLAQLLLRANTTVPGPVLIDRVWPNGAPPSAATALRVLLSQLRKTLVSAGTDPGVRLDSVPGAGWNLRVDAGRVDVDEFEDAVRRGGHAAEHGDDPSAVATWRGALGLWRGRALDGLADELDEARIAATRWEELRLTTIEQCLEAELRLGRHATVTPELDAFVAEHPLREGLVATLMLALYRAGRQTEALRVFARTRRALVDELGIEPDDRLRDLERAILQHDPALELGADARLGVSGRLGSNPSPLVRLPRSVTSFVGRAQELEQLGGLLLDRRLISLIGAGGSGKTRLALALAHEQQARFKDGAAFADLSTISEGQLVPGVVATSIGMPGQRTATIDTLCNHIGEAEMLLVVDNCEHVIEPAAELIASLLVACPRVSVIATTREVLDVDGEHLYPVAPLSLPPRPGIADVDGVVTDHGRRELVASEAVQLFVERAMAARATLEMDDDSMLAVGSICYRLDGIPLAIELTAPLVTTMSPTELARRVDGQYALLDRARRRGPIPRQSTLAAAIDWSYHLLDDDERDLFQRLAVFVGSFGLDAVESIGADRRAGATTTRTLVSLVKKSMVVAMPNPSSGPRYRLLETLRTYALDKLVAARNEAEARRSHALHFLGIAERADRSAHGPGAGHWLPIVERDLPNLHGALAWSFEGGDLECAIRLAGSLHWFFGGMGHLDQMCTWLDAVLGSPEPLEDPLRLLAVSARNTLAFSTGNYTQAWALGEEAIDLSRALADRRQLLIALVVRGGVAVYEGNTERAAACFTEAHGLSQELGDKWADAWLHTGLGIAARRDGRRAEATLLLETAIAIFDELANDHGRVLPLLNLAMIAQQQRDFPTAVARCREAIEAAERIGHRQLLHVTVCSLGRIHLDAGDVHRGRQLLLHSLQGYRGVEHWLTVAIAIEGLTIVAATRRGWVDAAVLLGFAGQIRDRYCIPLSPDRVREREALIATLDDHLGTEGRNRLLASGAALSLDEAIFHAAEATREGTDGAGTAHETAIERSRDASAV